MFTPLASPLRRVALFLLSVAFLGSLTACDDGPARTEILWDSWGVPHIYGSDADSLMYAFGWAQMRAHGDRILRLYGEARGRAAEYWGKQHLASDRRVRTLELPEHGRRWAEAQEQPFTGYIDAFVEGMNAYAETHADQIDDRREVVLPIRPSDVFAHTLRAIHVSFVAGGDLQRSQQWQRTAGSNAWAVAPSRSASDNAMLLTNPHLPWGDLYTWFEAQLVAPGLDAYGAALIGMPFPGVAFNDHLGWTHTVNTIDASDLYRLRLQDGGYAWDGGTRSFQTDTKVLKVRQPDGSMRVDSLTVRRSVHGPVVARDGDEALAIRIVGMKQSGLFEQYWRMLRASSLSDFEGALRRLQMPMFNVIYADRDGHIMYHFGGRVPERSRGDWGYWQGIVPGDTSGTLWTSVHAYEELPRVVDPPSGWVQNANDPPFTSTFPQRVRPADVPSYMAPRYPPESSVSIFRPQRSIEMVSSDSSITFDELADYKNDARMLAADRLLDDLLPAVEEYGSDRARGAATVLDNWDRTANAESRGGVLFASWLQAVADREEVFATPYQPGSPRSTPDGLADPQAAVEVLDRAARHVEREYDSLDVAWGQVHRLVGPNGSYPASGGNGIFGLFRVLWYSDMDEGARRAVGGDSYVALTEFTEDGPRARAVLPYGNASQPDSPHRGDQLELYSRKKLRPVWLSPDSVREHLERRTTF